ncbi:DMT family transporter [Dactylosporangium sucinum]|uniref:Membrane protein n=1 Tax=Dactylosporangium sucinum TaxID=1424081 RepID=A0A917TQD0_9ACTN|nr:EamA family transporter [Dactylosporangium sucinum]GGM33214.1 membrane protein [Dactylosporangium sucinum]
MAQTRALPVRWGLFFIAFAAASWGVGGFVAAILYRHSGLGPIAVTCWRYLGGLALLAALRPLLKKGKFHAKPRWLIVNGLGMALYQTAYYVAIDLAGVAIVTVVTLGSGPVLIAIGARLFLGERFGLMTLGVSLVGLVLLVTQSGAVGRHPLAGIAVALVSAAGYAAVTLLNRASDADAFDSALGGFAVGAVVLLPLAAAEGLLPARDGLAGTIGLLVFLGVVPTALAYAMFFSGLTVVRATTASVVALVEPLAAVALGVLVLHEPLTPWSALGALLLLSAVVALTRTEKDHGDERRRRTTAATANAAAAAAATSPHTHNRDGAGCGAGAATAAGDGGVCAVRASTTDSARAVLGDGAVTTTVQVPGVSTGPEE